MKQAPLPGRVLLALTVLVQLVVLYAPRAPSTGGVPGLDKVVHLVVFAVVALAAVRCALAVRWVAVALCAHAVLSEVVQHAVLPHRSGDPADVVADVLGIAAGLVLGMAGRGQRSQRAGRA